MNIKHVTPAPTEDLNMKEEFRVNSVKEPCLKMEIQREEAAGD